MIYTDSQAAKQAIEKICNTGIPEYETRKIIKMKNQTVLEAIREEILTERIAPEIIKVPAHTNDPIYIHNDTADQLAKRGTTESRMIHIPIQEMTLMNRNINGPNDEYPSTTIQKTYNAAIKKRPYKEF